MKKIRIVFASIIIFTLISLTAAGCGGRITLSETLPAPETSTVSQDNSASAPIVTEEAATAEETTANQSTAEEMTSANPPQPLTPTEAETEPPAHKPEPPKADGFIGTGQESYSPYGCDTERAKELAERIENGTLSTQGLFKNTLFVGDSIIVGFADYKLANQGNVIAGVGAMLNPHLADNMQKIIDYNPEVLVIHYGLNEMGGDDFFVRSFIKELRAELEVLKAELPYTKIVVMSMWPIKDAAAAKQPRLANLPNYNKEIRNLCVELGVAYDERSELFTSNPDWYQNDGIHCVKQMYLAWIKDFIIEMGLY